MNNPQPMPRAARLQRVDSQERSFALAQPGDPLLGSFQDLPGTWSGKGTGWNLIALPFAQGDSGFRLLMNQYNEQLTFSLVDKGVPNRGIGGPDPDQKLVALDYEQLIKQVAVEDEPASDLRGAVNPPAGIHHEPGLFLDLLNHTDGGPTIARLATIPHGDSVTALGNATQVDGPPTIPFIDARPIGAPTDPSEREKYLAPYDFFITNPFKGTVAAAGFPGFSPVGAQALLELAIQGEEITRTTQLEFASTDVVGGISNIPFVVKQANAATMRSFFWIEERPNKPLQLQYLQIVVLEFFGRKDGMPGRIEWPHVSINTLEKISDEAVADPDF
ncbi:hypothetical protein GCM10009836_51560 [Pseudonocardia ailaonensis]|uniref:Uncharacterized protein n=1 Tax=Pseudonocardia ailaonensis TaxID=367279 RepID=A0ABN2NDW4_9PSEU